MDESHFVLILFTIVAVFVWILCMWRNCSRLILL